MLRRKVRTVTTVLVLGLTMLLSTPVASEAGILTGNRSERVSMLVDSEGNGFSDYVLHIWLALLRVTSKDGPSLVPDG